MSCALSLSTRRAAEIYKESLWLRRQLYSDAQTFKVTDAWKEISDGNPKWKTKLHRTKNIEDYELRASLVVLGDFVTLTADERLIEKADRGCKMSNFTLAHEIGGHLNLDHHRNSATLKHFQLFSNERGLCNIPPTLEELEANYGGVFFQCGAALERKDLTAIELANRFNTDVSYARKAQSIVQLEVFQKALNETTKSYPRIVL